MGTTAKGGVGGVMMVATAIDGRRGLGKDERRRSWMRRNYADHGLG